MLFSALLLLAGLAAPAQGKPKPSPPSAPPATGVLTLKAARTQGPGATVTVRGLVINGPELGGLRFIQDGESGLALYALPGRVQGFDELRAGDSVQVTGLLKNYQSLLEMDPVASVRKITSGKALHPLKVPVTAVTSAFVEANEGRLLEIGGVTRITNADGSPITGLAANTNYLLDGQTAAPMRINLASSGTDGLINAPVPKGEPFQVRGILGQFSPAGTGGYQLLPRLATDFVRGGGLPRITAEPIPVVVTNQSVTIEFTTLYPGDTRVSYGPSANELTDTRSDDALSTQHRITLDGLEPGTTYYVKVTSRNAAGTATSPAVPIITGGKKSGRSRR